MRSNFALKMQALGYIVTVGFFGLSEGHAVTRSTIEIAGDGPERRE